MKYYCIILFTILLSIESSAQIPPNPISYFQFVNGIANDNLGYNHGTNHNTYSSIDRFGCLNRSCNYNISDTSFISLGDNYDNFIAVPNAKFSFSLWFKRQNFTSAFHSLIGKYSHNGCNESERQYELKIHTDHTIEFGYFSALSTQNYRVVRGTTQILDSAWHHVVITYDGTVNTNNGIDRVKLYLDNNPENLSLTSSSGI